MTRGMPFSHQYKPQFFPLALLLITKETNYLCNQNFTYLWENSLFYSKVKYVLARKQ